MKRQDFNKQWKLGSVGTAFQALMQRGQAAKEPQMVDLPHDAMIFTERNKDNPGGGAIGFFGGGDISYTKTLFVPVADKGKTHYLEFEGVYMNAVVKVNSEFVGKCGQGYTDFFVNITDFLKYGEDNEIVVIAQNANQPNSRWYSGTGIYRNVKLLVGEPMHIAPDGLRITTLDSSPEISALLVETDICNKSTVAETAYLKVVITDMAGNRIQETSSKFHICGGEQLTVEQRIYLHGAAQWDPDSPNLYKCESCVILEGKAVDCDEAVFGIRKLSLDTLNGLQINGKSYKLKGGCIHHDNGVLGAATFEDAEDRRVRLLKAAGYNAIRSAHNPTSKALLDACDRHGMIVMDEYSDIWTFCKSKYDYAYQMPDNWEADLERMVRRGYNHPSIVFYSIGNEIPETGYAVTSGLARKMARKIRSFDQTRYITNGINPMVSTINRLMEIATSAGAGGDEAKGSEINEMMSNLKNFKRNINESPIVDVAIEESCDLLDVVGYNYATVRYAREQEKYPNRIFVGAETYPADLAENWAEVMKSPCILGDFSWTAWDYLGEAGIGNIRYADTADQFYGSYPWIAAWCGDLDITGYRRPVSYWREIVWGGRDHVPYIAVQKPERYGQASMPSTWSWTDSVSSWTWPGFEGKPAVVEVYSDAEEIELFVNGQSKGRKPVGDEFKPFYCKWDVVYEQGEIEAIAYISDAEVGRYGLKTAGTPILKVTKESDCLAAGSNELCYVTIELVDSNGTLNTAAEKNVTVSVERCAVIQGSGSGNPTTDENYFECTHKTFYGRMLAVVRAGAEKGTARLCVSAEEMECVIIEIPVI